MLADVVEVDLVQRPERLPRVRVMRADRRGHFHCADPVVERGEFGEGLMVFLSTGESHHDLALVQGDPDAQTGSIGLHHFAFKIGDSLQELVAAKEDLDARGVPVHATFDFRVSKALIVSDPDGNTVELYVDSHPEEWRAEPSVVASAAPLNL